MGSLYGEFRKQLRKAGSTFQGKQGPRLIWDRLAVFSDQLEACATCGFPFEMDDSVYGSEETYDVFCSKKCVGQADNF